MQTAAKEAAGFSLSCLDAMRNCAKMKPVVSLERIDSQTVKSRSRRGTEELLEYETLEHKGKEKNEDEAETEATEAPVVVGDIDAAVLAERGEEGVVRREPEDVGRLEAPAADVLVEDNAPEIGMVDIEAVFDNHENLFAIDEGYESGSIFTYYAPQEEEEMINGELSSSSSGSDDEYIPEGNVNIDALLVERPRRSRRR